MVSAMIKGRRGGCESLLIECGTRRMCTTLVLLMSVGKLKFVLQVGFDTTSFPGFA